MRNTVVLVLALMTATPALGQGLFEKATQEAAKAPADAASQPAGAPESLLGGLAFELNGYVRGDLFIGKFDGKSATEIKSGYGEAALQLRARKGMWGDAYGELRLRSGYENQERSTSFDLREAYLNLYLGPVDIRLGHQVIIWGRADGVNPTNNLTPRDLRIRSPLEDDARLANFALRTHVNLDPIRLEFVWVPFYAPSHFPRFELPSPLALADPAYPDTDIENGTLAARVHLLFAAFEASVSYLVGYAPFPGITLRSVEPRVGEPPLVSVAFAAYHQQVVGADFSTAIGPIGLRGEFAYRRPFEYEERMHAPLPDLQYVLGIDHEFLGQLNLIVQYYGRFVFDWEEIGDGGAPPGPPSEDVMLQELTHKNRMISGQLERWQHSATIRVEWKLLQETLRLELLGTYNFSTEELMLRPKVAYDITDALTVTVGGEIFLGAEETLFGMIEESQSAGYVELKASF